MKNRSLFYMSLGAAFFALCVIMLGSFTRLADAGLGCPDWPTCYGHLWVPQTAEEISTANQNFSDTPVETDKTWPEQLHRILAKNLGVFILIIFVAALIENIKTAPWKSVTLLLALLVVATIARIFTGDSLDMTLLVLVAVYFVNIIRLSGYKKLRSLAAEGSVDIPFLLPAFIAGLVVTQGLFGMWTVTLKLWPQVVTAHLLGGFTTLSLMVLLNQRLGQFYWRVNGNIYNKLSSIKKWAVLALVVVIIQIILGGWTAANYAALACPDFPLCQNQWIPTADYVKGFNILQSVGPNYLGGTMDNLSRTAIHFSHRVGAIIASVILLLLCVKLWWVSLSQAKIWATLVFILLVLQVLLGISNVVMHLPLSIAVAHNAIGACLMAVLVVVNHRLNTLKLTLQ